MTWKTTAGALTLATLAAAPAFALRTGAGAEDPEEVLNELTDEYYGALGDYHAKLEELRESGAGENELAEFTASWDPTPAYAELFMDQARAHAGQPAAYDFLQWVVRNPAGRPDEPLPEVVVEALDLILAHHIDEPGFQSFAIGLHYLAYTQGSTRTLALIDRALAAAGRAEGPLAARLTLARAHVVMGDESADEAARATARASLEALVEHEAIGEQVRGYLFELDHLQIGMIAPEIEGQDLEGVSFKLSDYRGKVVLLDFWGDW